MLVFLGGLDLSLINGKGDLGLSLIFVLGGLFVGLPIGILLVFLGRRTMTFGIPRVNFPNIKGWLQVSFYFYIIGLLNHFFLCIQVLPSMVQLGLDG